MSRAPSSCRRKDGYRAAKGHDFDVATLSYRSGDQFLAVKGRTTQPVYVLDSTGRVYTSSVHDLPSARTQGEPLTGRLNPPAGALFIGLMTGAPEGWYLLAGSTGYGFRVQLQEVSSKNKAGKAALSLPEGATGLKPLAIKDATNLLAVVTLQGQLLVFPVMDLPELAKGKGNKIIQIPPVDLASGADKVVDLLVLPVGAALRIIAGKRHLTLKPSDIALFSGARAKRGLPLPRGFQRVDGLALEE